MKVRIIEFPEITGIDLLLDRLEQELCGENYAQAIAFTLTLLQAFFAEMEGTDTNCLIYEKLVEINALLQTDDEFYSGDDPQ